MPISSNAGYPSWMRKKRMKESTITEAEAQRRKMTLAMPSCSLPWGENQGLSRVPPGETILFVLCSDSFDEYKGKMGGSASGSP